MAKTLKDFLNERQLGPMVVKNPDEQKFIDKHVIAKVADRNGNDDEVFKGSKVKFADRKKDRKGYNPGEDEAVYEELKGNQHKIDANKNGKVDAHDFKLLRAKKKKVAEEAEELEELSKSTMGAYTKKAAADFSARKPKMGYDGQLKKMQNRKVGVDRALNKMYAEEAEQIDELSTPTLQSYRKKARAQGNAIVDKMKMGGGDWSKDQKDTKTLRKRAAGAQASGKQLVKRGESLKTEEAEQIDELSRDTLRRYRMKSKAIGDNEKGDIGYRSKGRDLAARKTHGGQWGIPKAKVMAKEEAEPIEELSKATLRSYAQNAKDQMSRSDTVAGREMGARAIGAKPSARERMHNRRADKRHAGLGLAIDKLAREEVEIEEKLDMKKASMGTVIKDFQKSDAPQFKGKSQKKRQVMAIAAKLSAERGGKPLNKEERLLTNLGDLAETHKRTLLNVFAKLNEDNQRKFMAACETPEGVEQMLDFAIQNRGE